MLKPPNEPEPMPDDTDRPVGELVHELIEDTRNFVRNSPGVALAGAAVVGFVVARLLKTGVSSDDEADDD